MMVCRIFFAKYIKNNICNIPAPVTPYDKFLTKLVLKKYDANKITIKTTLSIMGAAAAAANLL